VDWLLKAIIVWLVLDHTSANDGVEEELDDDHVDYDLKLL